MRLLTALTCFALLAVSAPLHAEDKAATKPAPVQAASSSVTAPPTAEKAKPKLDPSNPLVRLDKKTEELMKGLDENQLKQFAAIRTAHGAIRGVDTVRASLERAVKSCVKANPVLDKDMNGTFQNWKNDVLPVVRQSENRLEKLILLQNFTRPSTVRAYLKTFDDAVKFQNSQFQEVPVSEKSACQDMTKNMAESQKSLISLLTQTLGLNQEPADPEPAKKKP